MADKRYEGASKNISDKESEEETEEKSESDLEKELSEKEDKSKEEDSDKDEDPDEEDSKEIEEKESSGREVRVDENFNKPTGVDWRNVGFSHGWSLETEERSDYYSRDTEEQDENTRGNIARNLEDNLEGIVPFSEDENQRGVQDKYDSFGKGYSDNKNYETRSEQEMLGAQKIHSDYTVRQLGFDPVENARQRRFEDPRLDPNVRRSSSLERDYVLNTETGQLQSKENPKARKEGLRDFEKTDEGMYEVR